MADDGGLNIEGWIKAIAEAMIERGNIRERLSVIEDIKRKNSEFLKDEDNITISEAQQLLVVEYLKSTFNWQGTVLLKIDDENDFDEAISWITFKDIKLAKETADIIAAAGKIDDLDGASWTSFQKPVVKEERLEASIGKILDAVLELDDINQRLGVIDQLIEDNCLLLRHHDTLPISDIQHFVVARYLKDNFEWQGKAILRYDNPADLEEADLEEASDCAVIAGIELVMKDEMPAEAALNLTRSITTILDAILEQGNKKGRLHYIDDIIRKNALELMDEDFITISRAYQMLVIECLKNTFNWQGKVLLKIDDPVELKDAILWTSLMDIKLVEESVDEMAVGKIDDPDDRDIKLAKGTMEMSIIAILDAILEHGNIIGKLRALNNIIMENCVLLLDQGTLPISNVQHMGVASYLKSLDWQGKVRLNFDDPADREKACEYAVSKGIEVAKE